MAVTPSTMLPLGTPAPDFDLADPRGPRFKLATFADRPLLLVLFLSNHCPFVKHVKAELIRVAEEYFDRGLGVVAIQSNDPEKYPEDRPEKMIDEGYPFPYLFDPSQQVAKAYRAACTPDYFLFDADRKLIYRGRLDGSTPRNDVPLTGSDLRRALDLAVQGKQVEEAAQIPSMGCNIKWRPGNEPDYFG